MKKIQCIALLLALLVLSGCGEANARKREIAKGLADGNYHVLVPENEAASHADGTFEDYDTYCVFRLPDEKRFSSILTDRRRRTMMAATY